MTDYKDQIFGWRYPLVLLNIALETRTRVTLVIFYFSFRLLFKAEINRFLISLNVSNELNFHVTRSQRENVRKIMSSNLNSKWNRNMKDITETMQHLNIFYNNTTHPLMFKM